MSYLWSRKIAPTKQVTIPSPVVPTQLAVAVEEVVAEVVLPELPPVVEEPVPEPAPVVEEPVPEPTPVVEEPVPEPTPVVEEPVPEPPPVVEEPVPEPTPVVEEPVAEVILLVEEVKISKGKKCKNCGYVEECELCVAEDETKPE